MCVLLCCPLFKIDLFCVIYFLSQVFSCPLKNKSCQVQTLFLLQERVFLSHSINGLLNTVQDKKNIDLGCKRGLTYFCLLFFSSCCCRFLLLLLWFSIGSEGVLWLGSGVWQCVSQVSLWIGLLLWREFSQFIKNTTSSNSCYTHHMYHVMHFA